MADTPAGTADSGASAFNNLNRGVIDEFRANGGKTTGPFKNAPLILVTHTGAKSGKRYTTPLVHTLDGDRYVIIASKGGAPEHPSWYYNLKANPEVRIELPGDAFDALATEATGDERDRLYRAQADLMPNFDEYQQKTDRLMPVFVLERV
jgi:deazaflavin-dependent oxidoreductase (nitroreductase family)